MNSGDTKEEDLDTAVVSVEDFSFNHLKDRLEYAFPASYRRKIMDYFAFYRKKPVSAITHYAPIKKVIEDAEITGNYRLIAFGDNVHEEAIKVVFNELIELKTPVTYSSQCSIQGVYYTKLEYIKESTSTSELFSLRKKSSGG